MAKVLVLNRQEFVPVFPAARVMPWMNDGRLREEAEAFGLLNSFVKPIYSPGCLGLFLYLPGGGVKVAGSCAGLNILLQLVVVALLFAKAFPMRRRWQNGLLLLIAPVLAVLIIAMRIALLAWINASGLPHKQWWFEFLHDSWGGLVFAGVAMQLFVCLYVYWLARQVAALGSR